MILFKSYVRSIIEFAIFVYFPNQKNNKNKIEGVQYSAIRAALGYRLSTPNNILLAESKLILIEERAKFLCKCHFQKILSFENSLINNNLIRYYLNFKKRKRKSKLKIIDNCFEKVWKNCSNQYVSNMYYNDYKTLVTKMDVNTVLGNELRSVDCPNQLLSDFLIVNKATAIYTDGSKIMGFRSVGAAYYCPELGIINKISIDRWASVYTAEAYAILNALKIVNDNPLLNFYIFSDSLSVLSSLNTIKWNIKTSSIIFQIKKTYNFIVENNPNQTIKFFWIPSHIGINGNETADVNAKLATESEPLDSIQIPFTDYYEYYKKEAKSSTIDFIKEQALNKGKQYFDNYFSNSLYPWYSKKNCLEELLLW